MFFPQEDPLISDVCISGIWQELLKGLKQLKTRKLETHWLCLFPTQAALPLALWTQNWACASLGEGDRADGSWGNHYQGRNAIKPSYFINMHFSCFHKHSCVPFLCSALPKLQIHKQHKYNHCFQPCSFGVICYTPALSTTDPVLCVCVYLYK